MVLGIGTFNFFMLINMSICDFDKKCKIKTSMSYMFKYGKHMLLNLTLRVQRWSLWPEVRGSLCFWEGGASRGRQREKGRDSAADAFIWEKKLEIQTLSRRVRDCDVLPPWGHWAKCNSYWWPKENSVIHRGVRDPRKWVCAQLFSLLNESTVVKANLVSVNGWKGNDFHSRLKKTVLHQTWVFTLASPWKCGYFYYGGIGKDLLDF